MSNRKWWDKFCRLQKYSFLMNQSTTGGVVKVPDSSGRWVDRDDVYKLADSVQDEINALESRLAAISGPRAIVNNEIHPILFDGHAVYCALTEKGRHCTSPENVSYVLDAVVRIMRAEVPTVNQVRASEGVAAVPGPVSELPPGVYAVADEVPEHCGYLTAGKHYPVSMDDEMMFKFTNDASLKTVSLWNKCPHLGGRSNWRRVVVPEVDHG